MITVCAVDTLGLTLLRRVCLPLSQLSVSCVSVGDVVLQAVVLIVLPRLLTDHPRPLPLPTVVNTGVRTVGQGSLGPFTLPQPSLQISHIDISNFPFPRLKDLNQPVINAGQFLNIVHDEGSADSAIERLSGEGESPRVAEVPAHHIGVLNTPAVVTNWPHPHHHVP